MKLALVTETFQPEVNGVAMTLGRVVAGLRARGHAVEVVRPRQEAETTSVDFLVPGFGLPFYRSLKFGWPAVARLEARWRE
jgi:hypothetical protein